MIDSPPEELEAVQASSTLGDVDDSDGCFIKISESGISVPDFVKRLDENDILVAIDGKLYLDGIKNLPSTFIPQGGLEDQEAKWLVTFCRGGVIFDILLERPLSSVFLVTTQEETESVKRIFSEHKFDDFQNYENFEVYKSKNRTCDIVSFKKDPLALILPILWLSKNRLYTPLSCILIVYLFSFFLNFYLLFLNLHLLNILHNILLHVDQF